MIREINKYDPIEKTRYCKKCRKTKRIGDFHVSTTAPGEYLRQCARCVNLVRRDRDKKPPKNINDKNTYLNGDFEIYC